MTQTYKDPATYLSDAVSKRGKSGFDGVYLHNVTVVAEANTDFNYKIAQPYVDCYTPPERVSLPDWYHLLVTLRSDHKIIQTILQGTGIIYQYLVEGPNLALNVFLPEVSVETFPYWVVSAQCALNFVAKFTGKMPTTIRFNIGLASRTWEDLAEDGEVQEIEVSY